jgi:hypothetical protein
MSERADALKQFYFINGRVDACNKMIADLQRRVEADEFKLVRLKEQFENTADAETEESV